jgi:hypothetical protein
MVLQDKCLESMKWSRDAACQIFGDGPGKYGPEKVDCCAFSIRYASLFSSSVRTIVSYDIWKMNIHQQAHRACRQRIEVLCRRHIFPARAIFFAKKRRSFVKNGQRSGNVW